MNPTISIVAAMAENRVIGKNNKIPWRIKEDLVHLRNLSTGHVVILGRKTYESMDWYYKKSGRQMPGKAYVIVTRDEKYKPERPNTYVAHSVEEALELAKDLEAGSSLRGDEVDEAITDSGRARMTMGSPLPTSRDRDDGNEPEIFIIGGQNIFEQTIGITNRLYLTIVKGDFEGDAYFPDYSEFTKVVSKEEKSEGEYQFTLLLLER